MARPSRSLPRPWRSAARSSASTIPDTLTSMNNLALLYESQGRYGEAEPLYARPWRSAARSSASSIPTPSPA